MRHNYAVGDWMPHPHYGPLNIVAVGHAVIGTRRGNDPVAWWAAMGDSEPHTSRESAAAASIAEGWDGVSRFVPSYIVTAVDRNGAYPVFT